MRRLITLLAVPTAVVAASLLASGVVSAHTETDLVAVPAGSEATVTLRPTHGCGDAPTVEVRIRAPFENATAGSVDGWQSSSEPDGAGNTVLSWTGGVLPADETGAFPVEFLVPDEPGLLLLFPAIQGCEGGEELAWISGDPASEYPAPRLLVLPAGSEPAATIDDVPADAPGREQLVEIVDVDAPGAATTVPATTVPAGTAAPATTAEVTTVAPSATTATTTATTPPTTPPTTPTTTPATTVPDDGNDDGNGDDGADDEGGTGPLVAVAGVAVALAALIAGAVVLRRRRP